MDEEVPLMQGDVVEYDNGIRRVVAYVQPARDLYDTQKTLPAVVFYFDDEPEEVILAGGGTARVMVIDPWGDSWPIEGKAYRDGRCIYSSDTTDGSL